MALTYTTLEAFLGYTFTTKPTQAQVSAIMALAENELAGKVGTVDNTDYNEAMIICLIAIQHLEVAEWIRQGLASSSSSPAGSTNKAYKPEIFTPAIKAEIFSVYGIDIDEITTSGIDVYTSNTLTVDDR